ncbi:MAG: HAD-IIB family hydrolase [Ruminococcaceae bacterium]|nr:HAD-IIB family hydrolase [Oscillospiraceae bacterium]
MKSMFKLIVSDLDGTLLPYGDEKVSDEVITSVEKILDLGMVFGISSGRTYGELESFLPMFRDRIYFTCCDGALTVKDGKVLYARKIETDDLERFFRNASSSFSFVLHGAFENYSFGDVPTEAAVYNSKPVGGIYEVRDRIFKITSYGESLELPEYCSLRTHWDGGRYNIAQYANRYCNKGTALSDLQMRLMLTKYDTAVFGDRGNDVCMAKGAKLSYCIGRRCKELEDVCTYRFDDAVSALDDLIAVIGNKE